MKARMRAAPLVAACLALGAGACRAVPPDAPWQVRVPTQEKANYRGLANMDGAGTAPGAMMYPAPNMGGLLVAIITHGVIAETQKNAQKQKLQQEADAVLAPYRARLDAVGQRELLQQALAKVRWGSARGLLERGEAGSGWLLEVAPLFEMTQDGRALVLDNAVKVYPPSQPAQPVFESVVRVVSQPRVADTGQPWGDPQSAALVEESANLLAHSLELALAAAHQPPAESAFRTLRYPLGGGERIERARPLSQLCQRIVAITLRGDLLSAPARSDGAAVPPETACKPALQGWN